MDCSVIEVSRALGGEGEEIANIVAKELGFRYVDNEIIDKAAAAVGVSPETVSQVERTDPLIVRIFAAMAASSLDSVVVDSDLVTLPVYTHNYQVVIEHIIRETATEGRAVIVAHGASIPLAGMSGLLRVFITASPSVRASRLAQEAKLSERDAFKAIQDSDRQRAQFLKRFYDVSRELPTHYDLVVNTDNLSATEAAKLVLTAARS